MKQAKAAALKVIFTLAIAAIFTATPARAGNTLIPENHKDPIVLVHGYFGSIAGMASVDVYWAYYITRFAIDGYKTYAIALDKGGIWSDIPSSAQKLKEFVDDVRAKTGAAKVDIVVHSEGGLVARYYIQKLGGAQYVDDLVTISTPHRGTTVATIGPGIAARQMEVYSDFLNNLNSGNYLVGDVNYTAIHSNNDEMVFPCENGFFRGAVNANVNLLGHGGILFNEDVYDIVKGAVSSQNGPDHRAIPIDIVKSSMTTNNPDVTLKITAINNHHIGDDVRQMQVSNNRFLTGASWENFSSSKSWKLDTSGGDGLKAVYIQFRKEDNFISMLEKRSPVYVDYIFLDRTPPTGGIDIVPTTTTSPDVELKISSADNSDQYKTLQGWNFMIAYGIPDLGVKDMMLSTDPGFSGASWQPVAASAHINVGPGAGIKTVYLKLRDGAGNVSAVYSDTVNVIDPAQPGVALIDESTRNPVVLVHGYMGSVVGDVSSYINWVYIYEKLKAEGYDVSRITLDNGALQDVRTSAAQLQSFVDQVLARTGAAKVDIVCHSEGGLVARYYIQNLGGASKVDDLVTFSTPWRGTTTATIGPGEAARQMEVGSDFIASLDTTGLPPGIEYTALHSNADEVILPGKNAFLKGATNVVWNIYGHASILFSPDPYKVMLTAISKRRVSDTQPLPVAIGAQGMVTNAQSLDVTFFPTNHYDPDNAQKEMMVSLDPAFRGAAWEPVAAKKTISLASQPDGMIGVHVKYRAAGGTESPAYVDYIVLDRKAPEGSVAVASSDDKAHTVKLTLKASDDSDKYCCLNPANLLTSYGIRGIGLTDMQVSEKSDFSGAAWEPFAAEKTIPFSTVQGQKTVYARYRDKAGNVSAAMSATFFHFDDTGAFTALETKKDPVILVHGYGAIASDITSYINWAFYVVKLKADGFDTYVIPLSDGGMQDVKKSAAELQTFVLGVLAKTGASKVDIICHSEGGLVSRYFIQKLGGASVVDDLITISTPHRGTSVAAIGPGEAARQMEIASNFLQELNSGDPTVGSVDYNAIFSNDDKTVFPAQNAFFDGALNMAANGYDHATILFNDEVYKWVENALMMDIGHTTAQLPIHINRDSFVTTSPSVTLSLNYYNHNAPAAAPGQMKISNQRFLDDASWQPVAKTANWTLDSSADGLKAVYVKYKSADGTESPAYVDYIVLDRTAPTAKIIVQDNLGAPGAINLLISASDNTDDWSRLNLLDIPHSFGITGLGVKEMTISTDSGFTGASWEPIATSKNVTATPGMKIYAKFRDAAGNVSAPVSVEIPAVVQPPADTTVTTNITIDAGWNLIHIPAGIPDSLKQLLATASNRAGKIFDLNDKSFKNLLDAANSAGGSFVWFNSPAPVSQQLTLTAAASTGARIQLVPGWNLIAVPGLAQVPAGNITVLQGATSIALDAAAQAGLVMPSFLEFKNDIYTKTDTLLPLHAYLIRAYKQCILSIP